MKSLSPVYWKEANGGARSGYINSTGTLALELPYLRVGTINDDVAFYTDGTPWSKGLLWGIIKSNGLLIQSPRFSSYKPFQEMRAVAAVNDLGNFSFSFGYIDTYGDWKIPQKFLAAYSFSEGACYAKSGMETDLWSLFSLDGELIIDRFSLGGAFLKEGLAKSYRPETGRFGFRDRAGMWNIPPEFTGAHDFSEGLAAVLDGKPGKETLRFIDHSGSVVIKPSKYVSAENGFHEGLACVYRSVGRNGDGLAGYIDKNGEEVIPCQWGLGTAFSEGMAAVMDNKTRLWGYINRTGEVVIPPQFGAVHSFSGGLARVRMSKRAGPEDYIDTAGAIIWKAGTKPR